MLTPEQIQQRLSYLTGSDTSVICGVNPYQSAVQLWQYKTRRAIAEDISDRPAVHAGNMLEAAVASWFSFETGKELLEDNQFYIHATIPFLGGNIDRLVVGENALLECKTTQSDKGWGEGYERGDNTIPDHYLCQVIHYCAITNRDACYVAVLIRGIDFRWFKYERDEALEKQIIDREVKFWNENILADVAPEAASSDDVKRLLNGFVNKGEPHLADANLCEMVESLREIKQNIKDMVATQEDMENKICMQMNDKEFMLDLSGKIIATWKQRPGSERFDSKKFKTERPDIYKTFTTRGKMVRTLLLK